MAEKAIIAVMNMGIQTEHGLINKNKTKKGIKKDGNLLYAYSGHTERLEVIPGGKNIFEK